MPFENEQNNRSLFSLRPKKFAGDDLDAAASSAASRPAQRFQQTDAHDFDAPHRHRDRAEDFA